MDYRIEAKEAITVVGVVREIQDDAAFTEVPKFWQEHFQGGGGKHVCGMFGVCYEHDRDKKKFNYMIADCVEGKGELPASFVTKEMPAGTWAVFPVKGAMPKALQDVNNRIWSEWLPNCREYEMDGDIIVEMYSDGDTDSADYYSEIWLPVKAR